MSIVFDLNAVKQEHELECRACLQTIDPDCIYYNIFDCWPDDAGSIGRSIAEDLSRIAEISLLETDQHSKIICSMCLSLLQSSCSFVTTVRASDDILRQRFINDDQNKTNERIWPKPILVDKNVSSSILNNLENVNILCNNIKEEVLSDTEHESSKEQEFENMDIKVEPEEIQEQTQQNIANGTDPPDPDPQLNVHITNGEDINNEECLEELDDNELSESQIKQELLSEDDDSEMVCTDLPLECLLCMKQFNSVTGLKAHVIALHSYKGVKRKSSNNISPEIEKVKYTCSICRRCFDTPTDLMVHETCHNKSVCYGCNENFDTFLELTKHRRRCKAVSNNKIRKLKTLDDVKRPVTRRSRTTYKCTHCGEEFSDSYYLTIHEEVRHTTRCELNKSKHNGEDYTDTEVLERLFEIKR